jgi:trehalose-phosphatase
VTVPAWPPPDGLAARLRGGPLLLLLDVDGTLAPIAPRPEAAAIPHETLAALRALAALPDTSVVFVSGRAAADARRLAQVPNSWVIGNHGFEMITPGGDVAPDDAVRPFVPALREAAARAAALAVGWDGVLVEDKRWTLSVHYRLADPAVVPGLVAGLDAIAAQLGLRVTGGKQVIELRPPLDIHKGTAALRLARQLTGDTGARVLCAGDDRTDEDMFRSIRATWPSAVTVHVGNDPTQTEAEFSVANPAALRQMLEWLAASRAV